MCQDTRSRSAASDPRIWATRSLLNALLVSAGAGSARNRTNGSPTSHSCLRQYAHVVRSAANPDVERRSRLVVPHEGEPPAHPIRLQDQQRHIRVRAEVGDKRFNTMP